MPWLIVDLVLGGAALVLLILCGLTLYHRTRALGRAVGAASDRVGAATADIPSARIPTAQDPSVGRSSTYAGS